MSEAFEALGEGRYRVSGELGFETVPDIWRQSRAALDAAADPVIDLGGVTQVDSAGLALVIEWMRWARSNGRKLSFVAIPDGLMALARISEVDKFLDGAKGKG